jgi:hypothetical protein
MSPFLARGVIRDYKGLFVPFFQGQENGEKSRGSQQEKANFFKAHLTRSSGEIQGNYTLSDRKTL